MAKTVGAPADAGGSRALRDQARKEVRGGVALRGVDGRSKGLLLATSDLRIGWLKEVLVNAGFQTELREGTLVVDKGVTVRKAGEYDIVVDGPLCDEYFEVRKILYGQYTVL